MKLIRSIRRPSPAFLISVVALFLTTGTTSAAAAHTHFLRVGKVTKTRGATALTSSNHTHPTLTLKTTRRQPAASFVTPKGQAPLRVSSATKVSNLNADLLDGLDSSELQLTVSGSCDTGSAIRAIAPAGTVTCATFPTVAPAWQLGGNAGTTAASSFLGTTDSQPLVVKTNGKEALRVTAAGDVGVGKTAPTSRVDVVAGTNQTAVSGTASAGVGVTGISTSFTGVLGQSTSATGVLGDSKVRGVVGTLGSAACAGTFAVGACGSTTGVGLSASSSSFDGIDASSGAGEAVRATSTSGDGVNAESTAGDGLFAHSVSGNGIEASAAQGGVGVSASSDTGDAVDGTSVTASGIFGSTFHPSGGSTAAGVIAQNNGGGDIFIGEANSSHVARIDSSGKGFFDGGTQNSGADYAEAIKAVAGSHLHRGDVLSIAGRYHVGASHGRYSHRVIGVYSTRPAVLAVGDHPNRQSLRGEVPVAMMGVVPTKVTAAGGTIHPGDLLTTSRLSGYAMRAKPVWIHGVAIYPTGAILGKALEPLHHGRGMIKVLLMSR